MHSATTYPKQAAVSNKGLNIATPARTLCACKRSKPPTHVARAASVDTKEDVKVGLSDAQDVSGGAEIMTGCPFLRSLPLPPKSPLPRLQSVLTTFTDPMENMELTLSDHTVVEENGIFSNIMVGDYEATRQALANEYKLFATGYPESFGKVLGPTAIVISEQERHQVLRRLLNPAFTMEQVSGYVPAMQRLAEQYLARWAASEEPVDLAEEIKMFAFRFIAQVVLGLNLKEEELEDMCRLFRETLVGMFSPITWEIPFTPYARAMAARRTLLVKLQSIIDDIRQQGNDGSNQGIMSVMVHARDDGGQGLSDEEIRDTAMNLLWAGHDTTSTALTCLMYEITKQPEVVQKLRSEQLLAASSDNNVLTAQSVRTMKYTEAVIWETMRMYPTVPGTLRKSKEEFELAGYRIEKDLLVQFAFGHMGMHDKRWAEVEGGPLALNVFNPDRYMEEGAVKGSAVQLQFGSGAHSCLGRNMALTMMKVLLAMLIRGHTLEYVGTKEVQWDKFPMIKPRGALQMRVASI